VANAATAAATRSRHRAKLFRELDLHTDATMISRKVPNHFAGITGVLVDVNDHRDIAAFVESNSSAEHFRLAHPVRGYFLLNGHYGPDIGMRRIEDAWGRTGERGEGNKSGEGSGR
jgi:hypothetical protein